MKQLVRRISLILAVSLMITGFAGAAAATKEYALDGETVTLSLPAAWKVLTLENAETEEERENLEKNGLLLQRVQEDGTPYLFTVSKQTVYDLTDTTGHAAGQEADHVVRDGGSKGLDRKNAGDSGLVFETSFSNTTADGKTIDTRLYRVRYAITEYRFTFQRIGSRFSEAEVTEIETILASVRIGGEKVQLPDAAQDFQDLQGHWAERYAAAAVERGLFTGVSRTAFAPDEPMTRAMLVMVLYRMAGTPETGGASFADVPSGAYYENAVAWAASQGIVQGDGGRFRPDDTVTRQELAALLYRYCGEAAEAVEDALGDFSDAASVAQWALAPVSWAVNRGLLNGSGGKLMPTKTATRAEVAAILVRYLDGE